MAALLMKSKTDKYNSQVKRMIAWHDAQVQAKDVIYRDRTFLRIGQICDVIDDVHQLDEFTVLLFELFSACVGHFCAIKKSHLLLQMFPNNYVETFRRLGKKVSRNDLFVPVLLAKIAALVIESDNVDELRRFINSKYKQFHRSAIELNGSTDYYLSRGHTVDCITVNGYAVLFNAKPIIIDGRFIDYGELLKNIYYPDYKPVAPNKFGY